MSYKTEFPDYDGELPAIEDLGFVDVSWHNDTCPIMDKELANGQTIAVACDYVDPSLREMGGTRFAVFVRDVPSGGVLLETDDAQKLRVFLQSLAYLTEQEV